MENSDIGESSCRRKPNNDKMSDSERPLKKAKFAWQVKGRYHLKDQEDITDNSAHDSNTPAVSAPTVNNEIIIDSINTDESELCSKTEENLEILGDYLLKQQDFSSLTPLLVPPSDKPVSEETPAQMPQDESASSTESNPLTFPEEACDLFVPVSSHVEDIDFANQSTSWKTYADDNLMYHPAKPLPTIVQQMKTEDQYLARWQARQIAKGFVDNTINRVLDSWLVAPLPQTYEDSHNIAIDVAEFFDNLPANNTVENEGILMAISAHGLQNNQSGSRSNDSSLHHRTFSSRICTIGLSGPNSESDDQNSPTSVSGSAQYRFSSDENDNERYISSICNLASSNPLPSSNILADVLDTPRAFDSSVSIDIRNAVKSCTEINTSSSKMIDKSRSKDNDNCSSPESSAWRHLSQPCNCSHNPRRSSITPNIPFHRRDILDHRPQSSPIPQEIIPVPEEAPSTDVPSESKKDDCLTDDKSSDGSVNEDDCQSGNNQTSSMYPLADDNDQQFDEHFDFMDAAVSFAIQNKGLTSFSSVDYG